MFVFKKRHEAVVEKLRLYKLKYNNALVDVTRHRINIAHLKNEIKQLNEEARTYRRKRDPITGRFIPKV